MNIDEEITKKIAFYGELGNIGHTIKIYQSIAQKNHSQVKLHSERVALLAENTALRIGKNPKAAFLGAMLHDIGKISLPDNLFGDDVVITAEEYGLIKTHAIKGFEILHKLHPFSALCAGLHHAVYDGGYGITKKDLPKIFKVKTIKEATEIAIIISICDFIDAFSHRKTHLVYTKDKKTEGLEDLLKEKYYNDHLIVNAALEAKKELKI